MTRRGPVCGTGRSSSEARFRHCCSASPSATSCWACRLTADGEFAGNFFTLLGFWRGGFNLLPLLIGVLGLSMILLQGASWVAVKAEGDLHDRAAALRSTFGVGLHRAGSVGNGRDGALRRHCVWQRGQVAGWVAVRGPADRLDRVGPHVDQRRQGHGGLGTPCR